MGEEESYKPVQGRTDWPPLLPVYAIVDTLHTFHRGNLRRSTCPLSLPPSLPHAGQRRRRCVLLLKGEISFSKNGKELGVAFKLPAGARGPFFPAVALKSAQVHASVNKDEKMGLPRAGHAPLAVEYALLCGGRLSQLVRKVVGCE